MGCGYKGLVFCRNNGRIMENMEKGLNVPKWMLKKVSTFQKQNTYQVLPFSKKQQRNFVHFFALASKEGWNKKWKH